MNRSGISVLFVLLVCVIAFGFYRGWFTLSSRGPGAESNKVNVNLTVDKGKMQEDAETVKIKATELTSTVTGQAKGSGDQPTKTVKVE
jgi:hypothetical protein